MEWFEVEKFVADFVLTRFHEVDEQELAQFAAEFKNAWRAISNQKNYDLSWAGEAYCLKYHLRRMDQVSIALRTVNLAHPLLPMDNASVLDVGSGTGASAMGLAYWTCQAPYLSGRAIHLRCIEKAHPMRETAKRILPLFLDNLKKSSKDLPHLSYEFPNSDLYKCAQEGRTLQVPLYDLIIFSYTFWKQPEQKWEITKDYVLSIANGLKPNGTILFLTPKQPIEKVNFMNSLSGRLQKEGFCKLDITQHPNFKPGITTNAVFGPTTQIRDELRRPKCLQDVIREINNICEHKVSSFPFGQGFLDDSEDWPFLGWDGTIQAFYRPSD